MESPKENEMADDENEQYRIKVEELTSAIGKDLEAIKEFFATGLKTLPAEEKLQFLLKFTDVMKKFREGGGFES